MNAHKNKYTIDDDLAPIIKGEVPLPNAEDVDPMQFLSNLSCVGHAWVPKWGWSKNGQHKEWTYYFLTPAGMGSSLDGGGYAVIYAGQNPRVVRFAICQHEKVAGFGANPQRGWHPGSCRHCGLDMTIDSGD